jgi:CBS domain-containing protein
MSITARDVMQRQVRTVSPENTLPEVEQLFVTYKVSGFPVVSGGQLVGIISRADIIRQLCVEHRVAEATSEFYRDEMGFQEEPIESLEKIAERVGTRIEHLRVDEVMIRNVVVVPPDAALQTIAQIMADRRIHRVCVTEQGRLVGIVATLDLVRLIANGRLGEA